MFKLSLFVMIGLTVAFALGLRWREERMAALRPAQRLRAGWLAQRRHALNRWVTAAALAAVATMLFFGGINWLRIWMG
ncbi:hypothetical protein [Crenalkalicoccus roseus]|uniref:hypothetical protein n=1 Tax=Crenalkalicoccus roseus TaxID=1485588 RepID=UPI0010805039|nr:hypothetical protein [Crenalkalicoccus roseus]